MVREEIDPKAIASAVEQNPDRLGKRVSAEELEALKKEPAISQMTTQQLLFRANQAPPLFLPIQLKRFKYRDDGSQAKLFKKISPSSELEIGQEGTDKKTSYNLAAVVIHQGGSTSGGHYYTYVPRIMNGKKVWIEFNDAMVILHDNPKDIEIVERDIQVHGYMHFYRRA
jgi:ubiquitin C-terminal hydrolase